MDIKITRGRPHKGQRIVIYGPEGVGKTTLASQFPDPLWIDTESSTDAIDVARMPAPKNWKDITDEVDYVAQEKPCKTLVIDSIDWAERYCIEQVCVEKKVDGIESIGYGKGYVYCKEKFQSLLNALRKITESGIHVVLICHAQIQKFEQPDELGAYDRWTLKLSKHDTPLVKEWSSMILFCNFKTLVVNVDGKGASKGINKGNGQKRVIYTTHHAAWDAKNRYNLPDEIPMDYEAIRGVIEDNPDSDKNSVQVEPKPEREPKKESEKPTAETVHPAPETTKGKGNPSEDKIEGKTLHILQPSIPEGIPKTLQDLMKENNVDENEIQRVVASKGYFPEDMPITEYPEDFINGVLVGAWSQVFDSIIKDREELMKDIPFD